MRYKHMTGLALAAGLALAGSVPALAESHGLPARAEMTDDGPVLVTPSGRTLYTFAADDSTPGKSQCTDVVVRDMADPTAGLGKWPFPGAEFQRSCLDRWPAYMADANARPGGDWSLIDRPEGKQWAYLGKPLYMSVKDLKPGDRNGVIQTNFGRRSWRVAAAPLEFPPGFGFIRVDDSLVLSTVDGKPIYTPGAKLLRRASLGVDLRIKPIAASLLASVGGDWSTVQTAPGVTQYAFKGKPLYLADGLSADTMMQSGDWEMVVVRKLAGNPAEIGKQLTLLGDVYTNKQGRTLYLYTCSAAGCDDPGGPAGYLAALCGKPEECARRWRPYRASANARSVGDWSVVEVADPMFKDPTGTIYPPDTQRVRAWAYRGRPVFTYYEDKEPGDIWGHETRWAFFSRFIALQVPGRELAD